MKKPIPKPRLCRVLVTGTGMKAHWQWACCLPGGWRLDGIGPTEVAAYDAWLVSWVCANG